MLTFDNIVSQNTDLPLLRSYSQLNFFIMSVFFNKTKCRSLQNEDVFNLNAGYIKKENIRFIPAKEFNLCILNAKCIDINWFSV